VLCTLSCVVYSQLCCVLSVVLCTLSCVVYSLEETTHLLCHGTARADSARILWVFYHNTPPPAILVWAFYLQKVSKFLLSFSVHHEDHAYGRE
jgi:steroid 5-alpha reductase family enzyme